MALFQIKNKNLNRVKERPFKLEKDLQQLTEVNLELLFNLKFVGSEFSLNQLRIDTLAFDVSSRAFVIIEYKKDRNFSVIDQGYAYLALMLNNKADFILEYNEQANKSIKKNDVDWSQSRILFISPSFTTYQREAINFRDLPIELWEVKRYDNDTIAFNEIKATTTKESIQKVSRNKGTVQTVSKEVKVYSELDHLADLPNKIKEYYNRYKEAILSWEGVGIKPKKQEIGYAVETIFCDFVLQKGNIKIMINLKKGNLDDPKGISVDMGNIGHWGNGDYQVRVNDNDDFDYIVSLIRQSYKFHNQ